jgi:hypothetical protein
MEVVSGLIGYSFFPNRPEGLVSKTMAMMMTVEASAIAGERSQLSAR